MDDEKRNLRQKVSKRTSMCESVEETVFEGHDGEEIITEHGNVANGYVEKGESAADLEDFEGVM